METAQHDKPSPPIIRKPKVAPVRLAVRALCVSAVVALLGCGGSGTSHRVQEARLLEDCRDLQKQIQATGRHITFFADPELARIQFMRGSRENARILTMAGERLRRDGASASTIASLERSHARFLELAQVAKVPERGHLIPSQSEYRKYDLLIGEAVKACVSGAREGAART
jgi:hypothetical protein